MKLSIITPTFNRADCLLRCLDSVTMQLDQLESCDSIEHVIVDDGSTDNTADIMRIYASEHRHVTPVFFDKNKGVNAARNAAVKTASGEWCLLLDSDDRLAPDAITSIIKTVKSNPGYRSYMFTVDDRVNEMAVYGDSHEFTFDDFLLGRVDGDFAHLLSRKLLLRYPFDEQLRIFEGIFFLRFYKDAKRMLFSNIVTHKLERNRNDSVSLTYVRFNDAIIKRHLLGAKLKLELFGDDYILRGRSDIVDNLRLEVAENALLLKDYKTGDAFLQQNKMSLKKLILRVVCTLRLSLIYKNALQLYLSAKHRKPNRGVN